MHNITVNEKKTNKFQFASLPGISQK